MTIGLKTKATVVIDISKMDESDRLKVTLENGDIYYLMWGGPYTVQWYIDDRQPDDPPGPVRSLGFHNWPDIGLVMKGCWWDYPKNIGNWEVDSPIVNIAASTVVEMRANLQQTGPN